MRAPARRPGGGNVGAGFMPAREAVAIPGNFPPNAARYRRRHEGMPPYGAAEHCGAPCRGGLRQHRTIWQEHSAKDFASYESYKRAGILYVFPPFITARMGQKIGRRPQTQLCGDALNIRPWGSCDFGGAFPGAYTMRPYIHARKLCLTGRFYNKLEYPSR